MKRILFCLCALAAMTGSLKAQGEEYYYQAPATVQGTRAGVLLPVIGVGVLAAGVATAIFFAASNGNDSSSSH